MIEKTLKIIVDEILEQMKNAGFSKGTCKLYRTTYNRLIRLSEKKGVKYYSQELGIEFINDDSHMIPENCKRYWREQTNKYKRCIRFIDLYLKNGVIDFSPTPTPREFPLKSEIFRKAFEDYVALMKQRELALNTLDGYRRFIYYFLEYLENKGYNDFSDIQEGDITTFIVFVCSEKYQSTSLGAHVPALRQFIEAREETKKFLIEIPLHLPKKREILNVYSDEEYQKIIDYLDVSDSMSLRNKAITIIALNTGLRAVDICGLKLSNIDWNSNCIHITQSKTDHVQNIPLSKEIGNALVDYILNERPTSTNSEYVFLKSKAPYKPLMTHTGIRKVLFDAVNDSKVDNKGRIYGTRITRHSTASRMLRNGVPLSVISCALGHSNPNSVMIYLTTDDAKLSECTLRIPFGGTR